MSRHAKPRLFRVGAGSLPGTPALTARLGSVIVPFGKLTTQDQITKAWTSPGSVSPDIGRSLRFGISWKNNATSNKNIVTNNAAGLFQGLAKFSCVWLVTPLALPANAGTRAMFAESVAGATSVRMSLYLVDDAFGATGTKWDVSFRTGTGASTRRDVNGGASGTPVVAGTDYVIGFTFDSVADLYTIYVNGVQDGQLAVAENAIAGTSPTTPALFLTDPAGANGINGMIAGFYMWRNRILTPAEMALINAQPFLILQTLPLATCLGYSAAPGGLSIPVAMATYRRRMAA